MQYKSPPANTLVTISAETLLISIAVAAVAIAEAEREAAVGTGGLLLVRGRRVIGQSALLLLADGERERKLLALTLPVDGERHLVAGLTGGDDLHKLAASYDYAVVVNDADDSVYSIPHLMNYSLK